MLGVSAMTSTAQAASPEPPPYPDPYAASAPDALTACVEGDWVLDTVDYAEQSRRRRTGAAPRARRC